MVKQRMKYLLSVYTWYVSLVPVWTKLQILHPTGQCVRYSHDMQSFIVHSMPVMQTPHFRAEIHALLLLYDTDTRTVSYTHLTLPTKRIV